MGGGGAGEISQQTELLRQLTGMLTAMNSRAIYTEAHQITPGSPVAAGRGIFFNCRAAGVVTVVLSSGTTLDIPVDVGSSIIDNLAVVDVAAMTGDTTVSVLK